MSAAGAVFPSWVMLEQFVFRRDDEESFPEESTAPITIRASGITSWDAPFRVAFRLAEPPLVSRIYAHLPGFPPPNKQVPLAILATHRHLVLLRVGTQTPEFVLVQDFFLYDATDDPSSSPLKALPPCTKPYMDYTRRDGRIPRRRPTPPGEEAKRRLLTVRSMGLLCRGELQEFAVAELKLYMPSRSKVYADICLLRSRTPGLSGKWDSMRVPILVGDNPDDTWQLCCWQTDAVIPFDRWLCWVDYHRGILFCDVFREPTPTVSFLRFPLDDFPSTHNRSLTCKWLYRGASAIDDGRALKFVDIARNDGIGYGALKPGASFTVTCHTLTPGSTVWSRDYIVTSDELWSANPPERLPRDILMFPQVNIERPHVVHFIISEFRYVLKMMWVVAIDMNTRTVESFSRYINGREDIGTEDADLTEKKSSSPMTFLPCEFSKFLHFSR